MKNRLLAVLSAAAVLGIAPVADATSSTKVGVLSITHYEYTSGGSTSNNTDADTEGNGFYSEMLSAGSGFTAGAHLQDTLVTDYDFIDPDLVSPNGGNDGNGFDIAGTAVSMAILHGVCNDALAGQVCYSDANCPVGSYCPNGTPFTGFPYPEFRICTKQQVHSLQTSSPINGYGNQVFYGQTYGSAPLKALALGEDSSSGGFDGAGTNGGDNIAILVHSCGFRSRYFVQDASYFFAGVHSLMFAMPTKIMANTYGVTVYSDTAQWGNRGITVANDILVNEWAAVSNAWLDPWVVSNSYTFPGPNYPFGGDHPDGANVVLAEDSTATAASWHANSESWIAAFADSNDAVGNGYYSYRAACNYDCNTYGW